MDPAVVGGKGASLARMGALGLPVPPAFALPVAACRRYHAGGRELDAATWDAVMEGVAVLEGRTGQRFGSEVAPLLVSVRSGAAVSMPGMMDTVLNLGMSDAIEEALARAAGDADFARATHARFCRCFGDIVLGADLADPVPGETALDVRTVVHQDVGKMIPADPLVQLRLAIHAVFDSWFSRRAIAYRRHWGLPEEAGGTAVIVQAMVFGNLGAESGTGVAFSRDPLSGESKVYGEWLPGGQGEDVVGGTHDCLPLGALGDQLPDVYAQLLAAAELLEREHGDVQDIEFTVERGTLYLLQSRSAKRSPVAAVRIAVDLVSEGRIAREEALTRVTVEQLASVLAPRLAAGAAASAAVIARGTPACPGVAAGRAVTDSDPTGWAAGQDLVLVRPTTSPQDVSAMIAARAVVTERGGATSHAAVVTRALGRPSVVGVGDTATGGWAGRNVTVDGYAGVVYDGLLPTVEVTEADVLGLPELAEWLRDACPVTVVETDSEVLDLDAAGVGVEPDAPIDADALAARVRGARAVCGAVLTTPEGARAVLAGGVPTVVRRPGQHAITLTLGLVHAAGELRERPAVTGPR